jgi:hydrogenase/urease accessory protein HupE
MKRIAFPALAIIGSATTALAHPGPHDEQSAAGALRHFITDPYHIAMLLAGVAIGGGLYAIVSRMQQCRELRVERAERR